LDKRGEPPLQQAQGGKAARQEKIPLYSPFCKGGGKGDFILSISKIATPHEVWLAMTILFITLPDGTDEID
jgi:hypothetical protein